MNRPDPTDSGGGAAPADNSALSPPRATGGRRHAFGPIPPDTCQPIARRSERGNLTDPAARAVCPDGARGTDTALTRRMDRCRPTTNKGKAGESKYESFSPRCGHSEQRLR
jgi:hypothetical protein